MIGWQRGLTFWETKFNERDLESFFSLFEWVAEARMWNVNAAVCINWLSQNRVTLGPVLQSWGLV